MNSFLKVFSLGTLSALASAGAAAAHGSYGSCSIWRPWYCFYGGHTDGGTTTASVPEIDASAGLLAVAAVATVLLFVWERRRRSA